MSPVCNRPSFRAEATYQRVCAVCLKPGPFNPHHVVYEQDLVRHAGLSGNQLYDTRNALRICTENVTNCHSRHHSRTRTIRTDELTDDNIAYAFEALGEWAADYLRRKYDDSSVDLRIERALAATL